ncbi:hypothetical protein Teth39_1561 [Thermoanaerobacter pseudethanolicus ATCC 33223]|jgi:hypothetical protein|uniref:Uncharacterized protein n=1 Tax=Thermoanaerobacter pseudethanolicus (strain ATCC 33223 / 39E) TaxID=340099 RepID=B0KAS2_THEP3|nr:hypothetical protein Teth39_1561 [Thermoanaerobacter pseudethanolicus ATCC 33223]MBZ4656577.1 hypothetical protein [Thermoanaerobacter sp.]MDI3528481.1 hypothetical protein [Thermoanaerobacter sp.]
MFQGGEVEDELNYQEFIFDVSEINNINESLMKLYRELLD